MVLRVIGAKASVDWNDRTAAIAAVEKRRPPTDAIFVDLCTLRLTAAAG
jgi:hypothetical protein